MHVLFKVSIYGNLEIPPQLFAPLEAHLEKIQAVVFCCGSSRSRKCREFSEDALTNACRLIREEACLVWQHPRILQCDMAEEGHISSPLHAILNEFGWPFTSKWPHLRIHAVVSAIVR